MEKNPHLHLLLLFIKRGADSSNNDHCVIIYDQSKWEIRDREKDIVKFKLGTNKPAILARLTARQSVDNPAPAESLIIGSVHYPGASDGKNHLMTVTEHLGKIALQANEKLFIAGDFNQSKNELNDKIGQLTTEYSLKKTTSGIDVSSLSVIEAKSNGGTMAGPDWGREH